MKIVQKSGDRLSIVPETDFEREHLGQFFFANEDRAVVVKRELGLDEVISVDIVVSNVKCPVTTPISDVKMCGRDGAEPRSCSCQVEDAPVENSLINLVNEI